MTISNSDLPKEVFSNLPNTSNEDAKVIRRFLANLRNDTSYTDAMNRAIILSLLPDNKDEKFFISFEHENFFRVVKVQDFKDDDCVINGHVVRFEIVEQDEDTCSHYQEWTIISSYVFAPLPDARPNVYPYKLAPSKFGN